jgi:hypothetical protein
MQSACAVLYCHLWLVWLYCIFPHCLINGTIFGKKLWNIKCVFWFYLQLLSETFLIPRRIGRDIIINVHRSSCKVAVIPVGFHWNLNFLDRFSKNPQISNFMKIRPVGAEFYEDGRTDTDRHLNTEFCPDIVLDLLVSSFSHSTPIVYSCSRLFSVLNR